MKNIKISLLEERDEDAWFDLSLRELRAGQVRFYKADDVKTGKWLFKVCIDTENSKNMIKAIKCPPGKIFSQLEGATMLFQQSIEPQLYYDIISLAKVDQEGRVRREIAQNIEDIPFFIRDNFEVKTYQEAKGKKLPRNYLVTLTKKDNEKEMITLFLLQRAWTLPVERTQKAINLLPILKKLEKTSTDEAYNVANEQFDLDKAEFNSLLLTLEEKRKIKRLEDNYIKVI